MPDVVVHKLVATERAVEKRGARNISPDEATQLVHNRHALLSNARVPERRRFLIGATDGERVLTLVVEKTVDPTTRLVVTGWSATARERRMVGTQR